MSVCLTTLYVLGHDDDSNAYGAHVGPSGHRGVTNKSGGITRERVSE